MRAEDLLAKAFPQVLACGETLPPGDLPVPWEHPMVRQTIEDCLTEAMDAEGFIGVLRALREGRIRRVAVDTPEPSAFARGILNAMPYAFLDDAPLEERRTQAVAARRSLDPKIADTPGALDPQGGARGAGVDGLGRGGRGRRVGLARLARGAGGGAAHGAGASQAWGGSIDGHRQDPPMARGRSTARPQETAPRPARGARPGHGAV